MTARVDVAVVRWASSGERHGFSINGGALLDRQKHVRRDSPYVRDARAGERLRGRHEVGGLGGSVVEFSGPAGSRPTHCLDLHEGWRPTLSGFASCRAGTTPHRSRRRLGPPRMPGRQSAAWGPCARSACPRCARASPCRCAAGDLAAFVAFQVPGGVLLSGPKALPPGRALASGTPQ
jgi:hypothetical protein